MPSTTSWTDVVLPEAAGVLQQSQPATPRSLQSMQVDIGGYEAHDGGGPLGAVVRMKSQKHRGKAKAFSRWADRRTHGRQCLLQRDRCL